MDDRAEIDPIQRRIAESVRFNLGDVPITDADGKPILLDVSESDAAQPEIDNQLVA